MNEQNGTASWIGKLKTLVIGGARNPFSPATYHSLSLAAFLAWVGLGSDGLSSSCYGPQEAFMALQGHTYLAIFVALAISFTIFVIGVNYSQVVELFPTGGGGYFVASKLLSPSLGMVSGCALLIDYVLTIALSVTSGTDAVFSFLPPEYSFFKLEFAIFGVIFLTILNLRGVRESVVPLIPIFLIFVFSHIFIIGYAVISHASSFPNIAAATANDVQQTSSSMGIFAMLVIMLRAYSLGAGTYTGLEAVSNGIPLLREPRVSTARRTMVYMMISLSFVVTGLFVAYLLYDVKPEPNKTLNAVLLKNLTLNWNSTTGSIFILVTLISEAAILFIAAQTGFLGGPRVLSNMALDRWLPTRFAILSDRLVNQNGILIMGVASFLMLLLAQAHTGQPRAAEFSAQATEASAVTRPTSAVDFLVVLYSINVFITFVLTQLGLVKHWFNERILGNSYKRKLAISAVGLALCTFILVSVTVVKFTEGGWITLLITGTLVCCVILIKRHYKHTAQLLRHLDERVMTILSKSSDMKPDASERPAPHFNPSGKTAVLLVNGFNGLGLHTLFNINRFFGGMFKNFIFIEVGVLDAGNFKGVDEVEHLKEHSSSEAHKYVDLMNRNGYWAQCFTSVSTDVVDEIVNVGQGILKSYPNAIFFGGQLMFPKEQFLGRWLHNNVIFAVQRRFYYQGIPIVILPIRVY
ncbi:MAG: APC family permease [Sedimentisphaerales bacterium]|nr:APC family permease [Sedimentisphaerales bacterium]